MPNPTAHLTHSATPLSDLLAMERDLTSEEFTRAVENFWPTPNTHLLVQYAEAGRITWDQAAEVGVNALTRLVAVMPV